MGCLASLLLILAIGALFTPCFTIASLTFAAATHPDQTYFWGRDTYRISAVKHSDESNWDTVSTEPPPIYWGNQPTNCTFDGKNDTIRAITGVWISHWSCHP
jgi:hypothetical protein